MTASPFYQNIKHRAVQMLSTDETLSPNQLWFALFHARDHVAITLTRSSTHPVAAIAAAIFNSSDFKRAMFEITTEAQNGETT